MKENGCREFAIHCGLAHKTASGFIWLRIQIIKEKAISLVVFLEIVMLSYVLGTKSAIYT